MVNYADDQYHRLRHPEFLSDDDLLVAWSHFADHAYFNMVRPSQPILEFGGGLGRIWWQWSPGREFAWLDPPKIGREMAARRGIESVACLRDLKGEHFDIVLCGHVLEDVDYPLGCLSELRNYLFASGHLICVVPIEGPCEPPNPNDLNHDLHCWNPQTLHNLLVRAGFALLDWHYEYYGARRKLLPVCRWFGGGAYAHCVRLVDWIFPFPELVTIGKRS